MIQTIIKILLAGLFFLCLFQMPYGFYELVRMIALVGFSILALKSYEANNKVEMIIYIGLALLFQPLVKIALGRQLWNIIDVVVGALLLISIIVNRKLVNKSS